MQPLDLVASELLEVLKELAELVQICVSVLIFLLEPIYDLLVGSDPFFVCLGQLLVRHFAFLNEQFGVEDNLLEH